MWIFPVLGLTTLLLIAETAAHEAGHVIGGLLVGFRFIEVGIGPLRVRRTPDGTRIALQRPHGGTAGHTTMVPVSGENLRVRHLVMVLAGPVGQALFATVLLLAVMATGMPRVATVFVGVPLSYSVVANLRPRRTKSGLRTDGAFACALLQDGAEADHICGMSVLGGQARLCARPRDWDERAVTVALGLSSNSHSRERATIELFACRHRLDRGDGEGALRHLQRGLAMDRFLNPAQRATVRIELAYVLARYRADALSARTAVGAVEPAIQQLVARGIAAPLLPGFLRAQAATLAIEGRLADARLCAANALSAVERRGADLYERDWILALVEWIDAEAPGAPRTLDSDERAS